MIFLHACHSLCLHNYSRYGGKLFVGCGVEVGDVIIVSKINSL